MKKDFTSKTKKEEKEFEEKIIKINRVSKKTKGGNRLSFSALMVLGDKKGRVGVGLGKASDVPGAMKKAVVDAKKKMIKVPLRGNTIAREITYKDGAVLLFLKPAAPGTGLIAGGTVKAVLEAAGVRDVLSKILGTMNQTNNAYAVIEALKEISSWNEIQKFRQGINEGKKKDEEKKQETKMKP